MATSGGRGLGEWRPIAIGNENPLDDLALALQRVIDRFVRHLRRGGAPERTHRRLLIVQIDGLSRVVLERGLASGTWPSSTACCVTGTGWSR